MGEKWIKEAEDLKSVGQSGTMSRNHSGVKVTWHVTVSGSGSAAFDSMAGYLASVKAEPQILYDPLTDRLGQYFPLDRSGRALRNDGSRPTNRDGTINIQIEVVAQPDGFTRYWKPGPNYRALMRAIRSWGIPDTWPSGQLSQSANHRVSRSWGNYVKSGHFGHSQVPGNDHWDPGPIDQQAIFTMARGSANPPSGGGSSSFYKPTGTKLTVKQIQGIVGAKADGYYGDNTKAAVAVYQRKLGVTADSLWGKDTQAAHDKKGSSAPAPRPAAKAPKFPLPRGHYFGPKSGPVSSVSGYYSHRADLKRWQAQMRKRGWSITADGLYGPATAKVARQFQKEKAGLAVDGLVGPATWAAAWVEPVT